MQATFGSYQMFSDIKSAFRGGIRVGDLGMQLCGETREFVSRSDMDNFS